MFQGRVRVRGGWQLQLYIGHGRMSIMTSTQQYAERWMANRPATGSRQRCVTRVWLLPRAATKLLQGPVHGIAIAAARTRTYTIVYSVYGNLDRDMRFGLNVHFLPFTLL